MASDTDSDDSGPVFRGLESSSDENSDTDSQGSGGGSEKPREPTLPPHDAGFLRGWHRPTTDRGPFHPLIALSDEHSLPRRCGDALKSNRATPRALFRLYWDNELLAGMEHATNVRLAKTSKAACPPVTKSELLRFIALTIAMGVNRQPQVAHYWRQNTFGACIACFLRS